MLLFYYFNDKDCSRPKQNIDERFDEHEYCEDPNFEINFSNFLILKVRLENLKAHFMERHVLK